MLRITLRTVTLVAACRWCSTRTMSSAVVPWRPAADPATGARGDGRILIAQALDELDGKGGHERSIAEPLQPDRRRVHRTAAEPEHVVREGVGLLARGAPPHDRLRHAAEILDEHDPDRDRHRHSSPIVSGCTRW